MMHTFSEFRNDIYNHHFCKLKGKWSADRKRAKSVEPGARRSTLYALRSMLYALFSENQETSNR